MGECWQQKHTEHAPTTKMECDYLNGWIEKLVTCKNLTQNGEPQRQSWGMHAHVCVYVCVCVSVVMSVMCVYMICM